MDDESFASEGVAPQEGGGGSGGPATNIRLYLRAAKLPKSILTHQQPDVVARVSLLAPTARGGDGGGSSSSSSSSSPPPSPPRAVGAAHRRYGSSQELPSHLVPPPPSSPNVVDDDDDDDDDGVSVGSVRSGGGGGEVGDLVDETEVVRKSSNPKWTTTFASRYEYGTQLLFFVDVFVVSGSASASAAVVVGNNAVHARAGMKLIGRAAFDVKDVLGTANKIKARRLRNGGVVYAHIEYEHANTDSDTQTTPSSPGRGRLLSSSAATRGSPCPGGRMLSLRLRADSLVHTHSRIKVAVSSRSRPSTYYEISRMSSSGGWIAAYRSPPVRESVTPMWDEASIDLGSSSDLDDIRLLIAVYKIKRTECKEIGSFETTVRKLIDSNTTQARITGYSRRSLRGAKEAGGGDAGGGGRTTFRLRRPAISDEVTGIISVVHAIVENNNDVRNRSQRFMSSFDDGDDDDGDGGGDGNVVSEMFDVDAASRIVAPHPPGLPSSDVRPKFVDYVRAGMVKVDFCVAVDFTSSNGDPRVPGTLHYSIPHMMNDYEEAIAAFGSTVERYSPNQEYPVWGFGAKYDGEVRHIFRCGDSKYAHGTEGVLKAYRSVFDTDLTMSGPTVISDVLRAGAGRARLFHNGPDKDLRYCILLILTDGCVHDLPFTQGLVRSYMDDDLPLSVIVVGIGRADFTEFHQWDLAPPEIRGRFKFVEFREHQIDPDNLPRKALLNLPHEIVDYYMGRGILPS